MYVHLFFRNNTGHRASIAASLVQGVYILERDRQNNREVGGDALAPAWYETFNFELQQVILDDKDKSIFGAIYKFKSPLNKYSTLHPPRYVIAFRGTLLELGTILRDIHMDLKVLCVPNKLQDCSRAEKALKVVKKLVDEFGAEDVWLAGHSLGSAIALIAGRNMVEMKFPLETYLFNPPFSSVAVALELLIKNKILKKGLRIVDSFFRVALSASLTDHHRTEDKQFSMLSSWTPYLFVNPRDPVCLEYVPYFKHRKTMKMIGASTIGKWATQISYKSMVTSCAFGYSSEPYHLIPSACLVTNSTSSIWHAHGLEQWWTKSSDWQYNLHEFY